ncbi:MAG: nucleotide exchange factor GrpE [Planctomycetota bacterium]
MPDERKDIIDENEAANAPDEDESCEETDGETVAQPVEISPKHIADLQKKAEERDDFLDKLQRTRADYLNYQKRVKKDRDQAAEFAVQDFLAQLIPLINDLERAVQSGEENHNMDAFFEGVKLLRTRLYKVLEDNGIKPIECVGRPFDPAYHEAITHQETSEHPSNTVIAELQRGFTMNGRTVVPARVIVAKAPAPPSAAKPAEEKAQEPSPKKDDQQSEK